MSHIPDAAVQVLQLNLRRPSRCAAVKRIRAALADMIKNGVKAKIGTEHNVESRFSPAYTAI